MNDPNSKPYTITKLKSEAKEARLAYDSTPQGQQALKELLKQHGDVNYEKKGRISTRIANGRAKRYGDEYAWRQEEEKRRLEKLINDDTQWKMQQNSKNAKTTQSVAPSVVAEAKIAINPESIGHTILSYIEYDYDGYGCNQTDYYGAHSCGPYECYTEYDNIRIDEDSLTKTDPRVFAARILGLPQDRPNMVPTEIVDVIKNETKLLDPYSYETETSPDYYGERIEIFPSDPQRFEEHVKKVYDKYFELDGATVNHSGYLYVKQAFPSGKERNPQKAVTEWVSKENPKAAASLPDFTMGDTKQEKLDALTIDRSVLKQASARKAETVTMGQRKQSIHGVVLQKKNGTKVLVAGYDYVKEIMDKGTKSGKFFIIQEK